MCVSPKRLALRELKDPGDGLPDGEEDLVSPKRLALRELKARALRSRNRDR